MREGPHAPARALLARTLAKGVALLGVLAAPGAPWAALPGPVGRAFRDAGIPHHAVAVYVHEVGARQPLLAHQAATPMNPASTIKLVTTYAALDILGPDYTWKTDAYALGTREGDVLHGDLLLKGYGDPKITLEAFQSFVRSLRQASGLREIRGDLLLDRSHFAATAHDPARFDAEPLRPYNVGPDALLANFKHVRFVITPDTGAGTVVVQPLPPMPRLELTNHLVLGKGSCGDWQALARATVVDHGSRAEVSLRGRYPAACGERGWNLSLFDHANYLHQLFQLAWQAEGGVFGGGVRDGVAPPGQPPIATLVSAPLADQVRDINKVSNNVMARQLFLTLASTRFTPPLDTRQAAAVVHEWMRAKGLPFTHLVLENGSGLSRSERISARSLGRLLLSAYASRHVTDLFSSLPVAAVDGTMRARLADRPAAGRAYLKTGSLEGVRAIAGYLFDVDGRRLVVVCFVNHRQAASATAAMDTLVQWLHAGAGGRQDGAVSP